MVAGVGLPFSFHHFVRTYPALRFPKERSGCFRICSFVFLTAAVLGRCLHPLRGGTVRAPTSSARRSHIRERMHKYQLSTDKKIAAAKATAFFCVRAIKKIFLPFCLRDLNLTGYSVSSSSVTSNPPINITFMRSFDSTTMHSIICLTT